MIKQFMLLSVLGTFLQLSLLIGLCSSATLPTGVTSPVSGPSINGLQNQLTNNMNPFPHLGKLISTTNNGIVSTYSSLRQPLNTLTSAILTQNPITGLMSSVFGMFGMNELPNQLGRTVSDFGTNTFDSLFQTGYSFGNAASGMMQRFGDVGNSLFRPLSTGLFTPVASFGNSLPVLNSGTSNTKPDAATTVPTNDTKQDNKTDEKKPEQPTVATNSTATEATTNLTAAATTPPAAT